MSERTFHKSTLKNGIRILSEQQKSGAISMGIWVETGTRDEAPYSKGISHFLEHLVFKGTKTRSAFDIALSLESLGGELNAHTTREYTCYHAYVLKEHWVHALEILSDLVSNMKVTPSDFDVEKSVILQEIAMSEDNDEDLIYDLFIKEALHPHPLSDSILGQKESIEGTSFSELKRYYKERYSGRNIFVSVAGDLDHEKWHEGVHFYLGHKPAGESIAKRRHVSKKSLPPTMNSFVSCREKSAEQLHLLLGWPSASFKDTLRFEAFVVNALLGGGMTSRLYQRIRETMGLTYNIYSQLHTFSDFGMINVFASAEPEKQKEVLLSIWKELNKLRSLSSGRHLTNKQLELFKTQLRGNILLGAEDIESRMNSIAINEMIFGQYKSVEEVIDEIMSIGKKSIQQFMDQYLFSNHFGLYLLGSQADATAEWANKHFKFYKT